MTTQATAYYLLCTRDGELTVGGVYTNPLTAQWWARKRGVEVVTAESATAEQKRVIETYNASSGN